MNLTMIFLPIVLFAFVDLILQRAKVNWPTTVQRAANYLFSVLLIAAVALLVFNAVAYLAQPAYFDGEENIAATAGYWLQGHPIYHDIASADQYSLLYGPLPILINAFFQKTFAGADVFFISKLPSVLSLLISLLAFFVLLYKKTDWAWQKQWLLVAFYAAVLIVYKTAAYNARPDSYICSLSVLALVVTETQWPNVVIAILLGVIGGLLLNCKLHALVILLPILFFYLERVKPRRVVLLSVIFVIACVATAIAPFLFTNVSAANYFKILRLMSGHGLDIDEFTGNITFVLPFLALLFVSGFNKTYRLTFYALAFSFFLTAIVASKIGAGSHHLLPFVPMITYFAGISNESSRLRHFSICCFLGVMWLVPNYEGRMIRFNRDSGAQARADIKNLRELETRYPGPKAMGVPDKNSFELFSYSPELVAHGGRLFLAPFAIMDFRLAHVELAEASYETLLHCDIHEFILPSAGEPWAAVTIYPPHSLVFSDRFRKLFKSNYERIDAVGKFALYRCKK